MSKNKIGNGTASLSRRIFKLKIPNYATYLKSPHWISTKEKWRNSGYFKGNKCHSLSCDGGGKLSLHHITYERFGCEAMADLILVCDSCHEKIHRLERRGVKLREATVVIVGYTH